LKRLVKQDEASATVGNDGRRRFVWNRKPYVSAGTPTQAQEAARIEHLLDGSLSGEAVFAYLKRREKSSPSKRLKAEAPTTLRPR
jgi:hypothetical protein